MFESLDSIMLPFKEESISNGLSVESPVGLVYGEEVKAEMASMKVFVVGSGAIGCELLKIFALLGVGCGSSPHAITPGDGGGDEPSEGPDLNGLKEGEGLWKGLSNGGIVLADMDQIERSNLNRQLLFRERHVGLAKAVVAAETVKEINPNIRVRAAEYKLCTESEAIFDTAFWDQVDVVTTALDNVDARRYIDSRCVRYCTWLIDAGTLGTKGNTQVNIYISIYICIYLQMYKYICTQKYGYMHIYTYIHICIYV
jgi:ubiquitin-activating enzyme E1